MAEPIIFGIDHGNGNMKTEHLVFPCGLVRQATKPVQFDNEDIIEYKDNFYMLSETRMPYKNNKTTDEDYFILTLFAICKEAKQRNIGISGKELIWSVGLPPADCSTQGAEFKKYFMDKAKLGLNFKFNDKQVSTNIKDCFVSPQNFAAVYTLKGELLKKYRTVYCIDIGDGTVDLLVIKKGKPDMSIRVSNKTGIAVLRSEIINKIQNTYGYNLTSDDVEQVLLGEATVLDDEIIKEIKKMKSEWLIKITNELHTHIPDFRTNPVVFLGGGALVLKDEIEKSDEYKTVEFIEDIKANAIGYSIIATTRLGAL